MKKINDFIEGIITNHLNSVFVIKGFPSYISNLEIFNIPIDQLELEINKQDLVQKLMSISQNNNNYTIQYHELLLLKKYEIVGIFELLKSSKEIKLIDIDLLQNQYLSLKSIINWGKISNKFDSDSPSLYHDIFSYLQGSEENYIYSYIDLDFQFSETFYFSNLFNQNENLIFEDLSNLKEFNKCVLNLILSKESFGLKINEVLKSDSHPKFVLLENYSTKIPFFYKKALMLLQYLTVPLTIIENKIEMTTKFHNDYKSVLARKNYTDFRKLKIYEDPDNETLMTVEISQESVISDIYENILKANSGEYYHDIFLTSPTGAGKSVMFQIPAVLAAEKHQLVTLVISPLIGLMNNQITNIEGFTNCAATLNSDITPINKEEIKRKISTLNDQGRYDLSILYVSPETLLSNMDIKVLIGERKIGLVVIDEAHIVSTWGKSFRPDYWYLGEYLRQLRKNNSFPIAAFTATAVYGGEDDMYYDIVESLFMNVHKPYLGVVKRNNILFQINIHNKQNDYDVEKKAIVSSHVFDNVQKDIKTLYYFPFKSLLTEVNKLSLQLLTKNQINKIGIYMGGNSLNSIEKQQSLNDFAEGKMNAMLATKAFGMGIDINDIEEVYHFAPTGNLADYVQEVGRVARREDIEGIARTDFFREDFRYIKQLYGLSSIKQFEVSEVAKKILDIYSKEKTRNFLVSPEAFSYIFGSTDYDEVETRLKTILLIIKKDLETTPKLFPYAFRFKPRTMFTEGLFLINDEDLPKVKSLNWDKYIKLNVYKENLTNESNIVNKGHINKVHSYYQGSLYELNFKQLWEDNYRELSFGQFKYYFYSNQLTDSNGKKINIEGIFKPKMLIDIETKNNLSLKEVGNELKKYLDGLDRAISYYKTNEKHFKVQELTEKMVEYFPIFNNRKSQMELITTSLINIFNNTLGINFNNFSQNKFLQFNPTTQRYSVLNVFYKSRISYINQKIYSYFSPSIDKVKRFVTKGNDLTNKSKKLQPDPIVIISQLAELFGLVTYKIKAGDNAQFFMRINSVSSLQKIANNEIESNTIALVKRRHENSISLMSYFFESKLDNEERWNLIEDYFLGKTNNTIFISNEDISDDYK